MKTYLDCLPCFVRQTLEACRMVSDDAGVHERILRQVLVELSSMSFDKPPPFMALKIHRLVRERCGGRDPYKAIKDRFNHFALDMLPDLKDIVKKSQDPFATAVRLAIAGNIIDFGVTGDLDKKRVKKAIQDSLDGPFAINHIDLLREAAAGAKSILYLGDNAGEIVFDKILIEELPREKVTFVVKGGPVINDATVEDARDTGMDDIVEVINNGSDAPGTILELCSTEFQKRFKEAGLIIAKGQGNYETLSAERNNIFFLLMVKCPVIAKDIGCKVGGMVAACLCGR